MQLPTIERRAEISGSLGHGEFTISSSSKMMSVLSDMLYANKIKAVIRELSTNAWDATKEAGAENFEVHLPTYSKPLFYIRDYGPGMTPERVRDVYATYGESTKEGTNEYIGCLGLGSKTPFCYHTKTSVVTVWNGGYKRIYNLYLGSNGKPQYDIVYEQPSNEPNGVKVEFPVHNKDIGSFFHEAKAVYKYFEKLPVLVSGKLDIEKTVPEMTGKGWEYSKTQGTSYIIMGNIAYPIDDEVISSSVEEENTVLSMGFNIFADIGSVDIQPNREGLQYNPVTTAYIMKRVRAIIQEVRHIVNEKIKNSHSLYNARCNAAQIKKERGIYNCINFANLEWNGTKLATILDVVDLHPHLYSNPNDADDFLRFGFFEFKSHKQKQTRILKETLFITGATHPEVYMVDIKNGFIGRLQAKCNNVRSNIYYIEYGTNTPPDKIQALKDHIGLCDKDVVLVSSLPAIIRNGNHGGSGVGKFTQIVELNTVHDHPQKQVTRNWSNTNINLDLGGVYVEFYRYETKGISIPVIFHLLSSLRKIGITIPPIYGIKSADLGDLPDNWQSFTDWAKEQTIKMVGKDGNLYAQCIADRDTYHRAINYTICYKNGCDKLNIIDLTKHSNIRSIQLVNTIYEDMQKCQKNLSNLDKYQEVEYIKEALGFQLPDSVVVKTDIVAKIQALVNLYPMLQCVTSSSFKNDVVYNYLKGN